MRSVRRLIDWLYRPVSAATPPKPDELVELTRFSLRQDADIAVWQLERHGIQAVAYHGGANGMAPHIGIVDGNRVMVMGRDLEQAASILARKRTRRTQR